MIRALVLIIVLIVVLAVVRSVWRAILQVRMGAIPDDVDVPEVVLIPDRGWQVTRSVTNGVCEVRVEHPEDGPARTWVVQLRDPGAVHQLDDAMRRAGILVRDLSRT